MNILVIEDEKAILENLIEMVQSHDPSARCVGCETPSAALAAIEAESFSLVLLDMQLPEMSGTELGQALIRECPWLKVIVVTAHNNYAVEAFELEAIDYLLKPVRPVRLFKALDKAAAILSGHRRAANLAPVPTAPRVQAFGSLTLAMGPEVLRWKRRTSMELFAYLLMHLNQPVSKYRICEDVFPDYETDRALVHLQTGIYQLRKNLSQFTREQIRIEYNDDHYRMTVGDCVYDVAAFERACDAMAPDRAHALAGIDGSDLAANGLPDERQDGDAGRRSRLLAAYRLYTDRFLGHHGWLWAVQRQVELESRFRSVLVALIELTLASGPARQADEYLSRLGELLGEEALDLDAYRIIRDHLL